MLDTKKLPTAVRNALADAEIEERQVRYMSVFECFDAFLRYEGIIGWTSVIILALDGIRAAKIPNHGSGSKQFTSDVG